MEVCLDMYRFRSSGLKLNEAHSDLKQILMHNLIRIILLLQIAYGPVDFLTLIGSSFGVENDEILFQDLNNVFIYFYRELSSFLYIHFFFFYEITSKFSYLKISLASFFVPDVCRLSSLKSLMRQLGKFPSPLNEKY